jgi:hypothetical protein
MSQFSTNIFFIQTTSDPTKIWLIFANKVLQKLKFKKNINNEKFAPKMIFLNEKELERFV